MLNQFAQTWCLVLYSSVLDRTRRLVTHITDYDSIKKYKLDRWQPDWSRFHGIFDLRAKRSTSMKRIFLLMSVMMLVGLPASAQKDENNRIKNAGQVMTEILNIPDDIPADILDKAECVIVLPSVLKFAIGFGGSYGRGVMSCRSGKEFTGPWSAPSMMALEGGSFGLQLGGQATDFVLLVMNKRGASSILSSQVKLGGDVAAAAGPKGRNAAASTDVTLRAEILSYSRSRGLFAGISLAGSTLRPDNDGNERLYGKGVSGEDIVINSKIRPPASAKLLVATLNKKSPRNKSD